MNASRLSFARRSLATACLALPVVLIAAPSSGDRAYTLYMGADIALEIGKEFHRVEDVNGSDFIVRVGGKPEIVPTHKGTARMRIDNDLKLGGTPITLGDLKVERDYTPARDPRRKFMRMAASSAGASAGAELSTFKSNQSEVNLAAVNANPYSTVQDRADAQYARDQAQLGESQSYIDMGSDMNSVAYQQQQLEIELAEENYDAIGLSFEVSSRTTLDRPYVLVIAQIRERDEKPGVFRNWIFAQKLDPIGPKPEKINIKQGGLPVGFELADFQVRLYNRGIEIPTNHAPRSVALTREEAQQYITIEHVAAHRDGTLPAAAAFGEVPADLKERVTSGEFTEPVYVKVAADGAVLGTFKDRDCRQPAASPYIDSLVSSVLFKPALEKGQPVEGVARLQLASLVN